MSDCRFCRCERGSHVLCLEAHPFHLIRYCTSSFTCRTCRIFSTWYSFLLVLARLRGDDASSSSAAAGASSGATPDADGGRTRTSDRLSLGLGGESTANSGAPFCGSSGVHDGNHDALAPVAAPSAAAAAATASDAAAIASACGLRCAGAACGDGMPPVCTATACCCAAAWCCACACCAAACAVFAAAWAACCARRCERAREAGGW
mmetsp:Transcript_62855/g.167122  ORF Transcript_62855/g.167122 Transcript_62855/m.167122 type:complete len:206 (+) Transcript_62855:494-1111(+)